MRRSAYITAFALVLLSCITASAGDLRVLRSAHYRVHTDVDQPLAEDMARRLDAMYEEYSRRLIEFRAIPENESFEVFLFAKREDYLTLTAHRFPNTGGVFMPSKNLLAAFLEGQGRDPLRRTLQHEAFHQFAHTAIGEDIPVWLNEGMAQYFEEGIWTGRSFMVGQVPPRRVRQLREDIANQRLFNFREFMSFSQEQWAENLAGDPDSGATQYNQAWGMVHFLVHGSNGSDRYRPRLIHMLRLIHTGRSAQEAFAQAFSPNIEGFQSRFMEFADTLSATPEASMIERQEVLADLLIALKDRGESFDRMSDFRKAVMESGYRLNYSKGRIKWQTEADPSIYFADLKGGMFHASELFFEQRLDASLPDIVCRCSDKYQLRTRFHQAGERIEHEVLIEPWTR